MVCFWLDLFKGLQVGGAYEYYFGVETYYHEKVLDDYSMSQEYLLLVYALGYNLVYFGRSGYELRSM